MLNSNKFTFVNVCFQYERNDDSGLYGRTLIIIRIRNHLNNVSPTAQSKHFL